MKLGITKNIDFATYRSCDITQQDTWKSVRRKCVSKSLITAFMSDPASWKAAPNKETTPAMLAGSLFDCLLTEPDKFSDRYVVSPYTEFRTNESKAWREETEQAGITVIKQEQLDVAKAQLAAVYSKLEAASILRKAEFQVAFKHKTAHPFSCKGLIDVLPNDKETIVDLKTCQAAALQSKRSLAKHIYDWQYHVQAGAYTSGYSLASGKERYRFKFIFITSTPPFRVAVVEIPLCAILLGADLYRAGVNRFAECLESNRWPSIWDGEVELDLPQYAYVGEGEG